MVNWDDDSPRLRKNLEQVLRGIKVSAQARDIPSIEDARGWQKDTMAGLHVPHKDYVGGFRGEGGRLNQDVEIGSAVGVLWANVADELKEFEKRLQRAVKALDNSYAHGEELDADGLAAVLELAAWSHAEWVRIHPFANGNGRTARLWANSILLRYGLPPVVRLRPRPDGGYSQAAARAMDGDWGPTITVFREMLDNYLTDDESTTTKPRNK
jgi:hypothetical protein